MTKQGIVFVCFLFLVFRGIGMASPSGDVHYIDSNSFLSRLKKKESIYMVDIQKKNDYLRHHFYGALPTGAYPVRSQQDRRKLADIVDDLDNNDNPVVIIGPRGTHASKRAYMVLAQQGIDPKRLAILKKGIRGWPHPELLLNTYGQ